MATIDYIINPPATTGRGTVYTSNNPYIANYSNFRRWLGSAQQLLPSQADLEAAADALLFYGQPAAQAEVARQEQLQAAAAAAKAKADALAKLSPGQRRMANLLWETPP